MRWLVSLGADVNLRDRFGGSALLDAMNQGHSGTHLEIMGFLSQQGGVLELDDAAGVMCQAAADGNQAYLARLLEMNISPDVAGACVPLPCVCLLACASCCSASSPCINGSNHP